MRIRCITNRHLISETDYFRQIERIVQAKPEAVIVREKDLTEPEYERLAVEVMRICETYQVPCILHTFVHTAIRLRADAIHLPLKDLMVMTEEEKVCFRVIGASTHSAEEALAAENAGATYITASHIYATDCKKGLTPKGIPFLREICRTVDIPVYALGGICAKNAGECIRAGAQGVCIMSECMKSADVERMLGQYEHHRDSGSS